MTTRTQQHRTTTVNAAPANGSLAPGELYIELADPAKLWVGVPSSVSAAGTKKILDNALLANALNKHGDSADGLITFTAGVNITATPANVPLAAQDTNTLQAASTSYVLNQAATTNPLINGTAAPGTSLRWARGDHVHPTDTTRAPLNSPALTGTPTTVTPPVDDNTLKIPTTAWVINQGATTNPLPGGAAAPGTSLRWARADHVHPGGVTVADTPPAGVPPGSIWFDSVGVQLYVLYQDPTGSPQWVVANNQTLGLTTLQNQVNALSNPNKLVNPFMEIDQAHEGSTVTANGYVVDGFASTVVSGSGGTLSASRGPTQGPPGSPYCLVHNIGTAASSVGATDQSTISTFVEADDLYDTNFGTATAKSLTLSFWFYSSLAGTYYVSLRNGASNRSYVTPFTVAAATWQLFTITIPGDTGGTCATSGNANGRTRSWCLAAGTTYQTAPGAWAAGNFLAGTGMTNTWITTAGAVSRLGPCKLEVGSTATPMLRQSFQQELARCQRYYEKSYDPGTAPGTVTSNGVSAINAQMPSGVNGGRTDSFKVTKRAQPTMTLYSPGTGTAGKARDLYNAADIAVGVGPALNAFSWSCTPSAVSYAMGANWVADARL